MRITDGRFKRRSGNNRKMRHGGYVSEILFHKYHIHPISSGATK